MTLTVCFDVLHSSFSLEPLEHALDKAIGAELRGKGSGARMVVMDWFHCAQRDFAMLTTINKPAPPPPIAQILRTTLGRSVHFAMYGSSPTNTSLQATPETSAYSDKLAPVLDALAELTPVPALEAGWKALTEAGGKVILVTNGAEAATKKYAQKGGVDGYVSTVISCDTLGCGKPDKRVYDAAHQAAEAQGAKDKADKWFVACHTWDVAAARKNGFLTGLVLSEQPPLGEEEQMAFWGMYGGKPDIIAPDIGAVIKQIVARRA